MKAYKSPPPTDEHEFQVYCHEWLKDNAWAIIGVSKPLVRVEKGVIIEPPQPFMHYAVPNGAKTPGRKVKDKFGKEKRVSLEAIKLLREGLLPGVADYFIAKPCGGFHGCYIEFKFGDNTQSKAQKQFQESVESEGYAYYLIYDNRNPSNGFIDPLLNFKVAVMQYFAN